ncbi:hypothetical protein [Carboxylicivirga sp. M1479]|uniref:hypothetical protein n=1 Tax=Carboxylicivirga sp. M1479 TaxID=2594476 RepID=UPI001177E112|nr:hypothetical protein [Carboxylicivirga sp. M1479]TRX63192.1 hypothetical protein FNN09_19050 [Carboxylicivirga sp. M1479]
MSKTVDLSEESLESLQKQLMHDEHFNSIALPRLKMINAIRKQLDDQGQLHWKVKYSPVNRSENSVIISLLDPRKKFHFYYNIPLGLRLQLQLYLGDNTFNFFEAHPLLIKLGVIDEATYPVQATMNTLPHLVLSKRKDAFETSLLMADELSTDAILQSRLYQLLQSVFNKFNAPLQSIINGKHQL